MQKIGFIPKEMVLMEGNADPMNIELRISPSMIQLTSEEVQQLENK
jgi:hypothetical protein